MKKSKKIIYVIALSTFLIIIFVFIVNNYLKPKTSEKIIVSVDQSSDYKKENLEQKDVSKHYKNFANIEGEFTDISDIYEKIKEVDEKFDINSYIQDENKVEEKTFYTLFETVNGGKTLNGYVIVVENKRFNVTKSEGNKFDINSENNISKNLDIKNIDDFLKKAEKENNVKFTLKKTELIYQDGKLYNAYEIESSFEEGKSVITLFEEK